MISQSLKCFAVTLKLEQQKNGVGYMCLNEYFGLVLMEIIVIDRHTLNTQPEEVPMYNGLIYSLLRCNFIVSLILIYQKNSKSSEL